MASLVFASARLRLVARASLLMASLVFASARLRLVAGAFLLMASLVFASARRRLVAGASLGGRAIALVPASTMPKYPGVQL